MRLKDHPGYILQSGKQTPVTDDRLDRVRQLKKENPNAGHRELAMLAFDSVYVVEKALR
jgi:hypothetical protein